MIKYRVIFLAIPRKVTRIFEKRHKEIIEKSRYLHERNEALQNLAFTYRKEVILNVKYLRETFLKEKDIKKKGKLFLWNLQEALKKKMKGKYANVTFMKVIEYPSMLQIAP